MLDKAVYVLGDAMLWVKCLVYFVKNVCSFICTNVIEIEWEY